MLRRIADRVDARWYRVAGVVVAIATFVLVFVAPWFRPTQVRQVVSDSQSVGFNNRFALFSLVAGVVLLAFLAYLRARPESEADGWPGDVVRATAESSENRVPRWLIGVFSAAVVLETIAVLLVYRDVGFSDAAYFIDRLYYIANGSRLLVDVEYSYGPLLIGPPYLIWLALRGVGVGMAQAYFVFVGVMHLVGLLATAWVLDRLDLPRLWRGVLFGTVALFTLAVITFGVNYTPIRFLAPAVAILLCVKTAERTWGVRALVLLAGVLLSFAISPEVGLVASAGLAAMLVFEGMGLDRRPLFAAAGVLALGIAGWLGYGMAGDSTSGAISSGAYYIPILPALPALVFTAMALCAGWGVGNEVSRGGWRANAGMLGWFTAAIVYMPAALGRADIVHLFWNGLMLTLIACAVASRLSPRVGAALSLSIALVFVAAAFSFSATALVPAAFKSAVRSGTISFDTATRLAVKLRRTDNMGRQWYRANNLDPMRPDDVAFLAQQGSVFAPFWLNGSAAEKLASAHALLPSFGPPRYSLSQGQVDKGVDMLNRTEYLVLPQDDYDYYRFSSNEASKAGPDAMMVAKHPATLAMTYYTGFPLLFTPIRPTLDPAARFGREMVRHWVVVKHSGDYLILRRARAPGSGPLGLK